MCIAEDMSGRMIILERWNYTRIWSLRSCIRQGALYTMVLCFMTICEQNYNKSLPQSVGAVGVATIFDKMDGSCVFVEARGG